MGNIVYISRILTWIFFLQTLVFFLLPVRTFANPRFRRQGNCTDFQGKSIKRGELYMPGPEVCSLCVCYNSEPQRCRAIFCSPPTDCNRYRAEVQCCEYICLDDVEANWIPDAMYIPPNQGNHSSAEATEASHVLVMFPLVIMRSFF